MAPIIQMMNYGVGTDTGDKCTIIHQYLYDDKYWTAYVEGQSQYAKRRGLDIIKPPKIEFVDPGTTYTIPDTFVNGYKRITTNNSVELYNNGTYSRLTIGNSITVNNNIVLTYMYDKDTVLYLFDKDKGGDITETTGGWKIVRVANSNGGPASASAHPITVNNSQIYIRAESHAYGFSGVLTNNKITATYKYLNIHFTNLNKTVLNDHCRYNGSASSTAFGTQYTVPNSSGSNVTMKVDISGWSNYHLGLNIMGHYNGAAGHAVMQIDKIWLSNS